MAKKRRTALTKAQALEMEPTIKEIFRMDTEGWACGLSVCGELFVGSIYCLYRAFWTYDSQTNRKFVEDMWADESFAKEVTV